jgi:hypothetical protein
MEKIRIRNTGLEIPLSRVRSVIQVFSATIQRVGLHDQALSFHTLHSSYASLPPTSTALQARDNYLYARILPVSPSLWLKFLTYSFYVRI